MPKFDQPETAVVDVVAWICIENRQLLCARTKGNEVFYLPGGKREPGETDWQGLAREVKEEVGVELIEATFEAITTIEEEAHGYAAPTTVVMKCFRADYVGVLKATSEIEQIVWLSYEQKQQCAPATQRVFEYLRGRALIN